MSGVVGRLVASACLPVLVCGLICRQSLDDSVPSQHSVVHREAPADHESPHGSVLLGQVARLVHEVGLVRAPIYEDQAREAIGIPGAIVRGISPSTTPAKTCKLSRVSHSCPHTSQLGLDRQPRYKGACERDDAGWSACQPNPTFIFSPAGPLEAEWVGH
jgi:hypothetical protein